MLEGSELSGGDDDTNAHTWEMEPPSGMGPTSGALGGALVPNAMALEVVSYPNNRLV